ncbi:MAG: hypothetical protein H0W40_17585 [Methylibium sp.]|uniref:hypothetical protein n=1 Tax=Methylibium sp. TaxID=2067992 RepID=UPI00180438EA|nr:hypothetical protein [Methylibium sp.]MBA3599166.1 hypothetical protein [Methylibium sp.]
MRAPRLSALFIAAAFAGAAMAKLPAPSPEAAAKAAETKDKAAWASQVAAYQLCKSQEATVTRYQADASKAGRDVKPGAAGAACTDPGPYAPKPAAPAAAATPASAPDKKS